MAIMRLGQLACVRSGDKGGSANIGVIAYTPEAYRWLCEHLTAEVVQDVFAFKGSRRVDRYDLPNLHALNFVLHGILGGGGSDSLRIDAQGKALGQMLLEHRVDVPEEVLG